MTKSPAVVPSPDALLPGTDAAGKSSVELPRPLVLCGPSGVGKGTLLARILLEHSELFAKCVSHTTRAPRQGEVDGVNYHFISRENMEKEIAEGKFIEYANVSEQADSLDGNFQGAEAACALLFDFLFA